MRQSQNKIFAFRAFTLIETLLVILLMSLIGLTTYRVLAAGLQVWGRGQQLKGEEDIAILLDKFSLDLRNTFSFSSLTLKGDEHHLSFPTVVYVRQDKKLSAGEPRYVRQMGLVAYEYDSDKAGIVRQMANYSQALKNKFQAPRLLAAPVTAFRFQYLYAQGRKFVLESDTDSGVPLAVDVLVEYKEKNGKDQQIRRRFYLIGKGQNAQGVYE